MLLEQIHIALAATAPKGFSLTVFGCNEKRGVALHAGECLNKRLERVGDGFEVISMKIGPLVEMDRGIYLPLLDF